MYSLLTLAHANMQAVGALDTRLLPWLAQETTIWEMRRGKGQDPGITALVHRLKIRPDIMMVDFTTNDLKKIESRAASKRKAHGDQRSGLRSPTHSLRMCKDVSQEITVGQTLTLTYLHTYALQSYESSLYCFGCPVILSHTQILNECEIYFLAGDCHH